MSTSTPDNNYPEKARNSGLFSCSKIFFIFFVPFCNLNSNIVKGLRLSEMKASFLFQIAFLESLLASGARKVFWRGHSAERQGCVQSPFDA